MTAWPYSADMPEPAYIVPNPPLAGYSAPAVRDKIAKNTAARDSIVSKLLFANRRSRVTFAFPTLQRHPSSTDDERVTFETSLLYVL